VYSKRTSENGVLDGEGVGLNGKKFGQILSGTTIR